MQSQTLITLGSYQFDNKYCLGQGSFGKVYKGKNLQTSKAVAIKQLDRALVSQKQINKQIQILKSLIHPNIVKYEDAFKTNQFFYIVTEYCNGGDLSNFMEGSSSEEEEGEGGQEHNLEKKEDDVVGKLYEMFFQVCEGFAYLHRFNIIHRDLKPTNILIHNGVYKIADFGVARTQQLHKSLIHNDLVGVPIYMSPQILSKNFYSYKCDVWSIGVIMYQFFFRKLPWKANDVNSLFFQIMANPTPFFDQNKKVPSLMQSIFENTLKYLQKQRMSWQQLLSLQKSRRKIFSLDKSKPQISPPVHDPKNQPQHQAHQQPPQQPNPYTDLSASKISKSIVPYEAELVHHIICQCQCLNQQLTSLVGVECLSAFVNTTKNYLLQGYQYRQFFVDCGFFMLKIAGENLHLYMIDLDGLQEARPLLILLELIHDLITMVPNPTQEFFRKVISASLRSSKIDQYAASVISKINTYRLKDKRQF